MENVRIGIVGIGNMGTGHAKYLLAGEVENAELTAVCDINPERLAFAKETYGEKVARFDSFEALKNSGLVDLVLIATPHYFHPVYAKEALEAGLHVLSEKPVGVYTKNVQELIDVAEKSDKIFAVMFNQRTNPLYQKVREMVHGGELGDLKRVVWTITNWYRPQAYYNSGSWRATWKGEGGGVLLNQCPHNLDLLQWICGMPKRIRAFCYFGKYHDIEVEDDVTAFLEYENGATGVFITTTGETPGANRLEISGNKGKLVVEDGKILFHKLAQDERDFNRTNTEGFAAPDCEVIEVKVEGEETAHRGITQNVVNAIVRGEPLLARGEEGIRSLTLSNAMHLSAWTDDWVELPIDADAFYRHLQEKIAGSQEKKNVKSVVFDTEGSFNSQK